MLGRVSTLMDDHLGILHVVTWESLQVLYTFAFLFYLLDCNLLHLNFVCIVEMAIPH